MAKTSTENNREKKKQRREAKASKKASNSKVEKRSKPNNLLLAILIFGVIAIIFGGVVGYHYFQKDSTIEKYLKTQSIEDTQMDDSTTMSVKAKKNHMKILFDTKSEDKAIVKEYTDLYSGKEGQEQLKYLGASYLVGMKPETRALFPKVTITAKVNDKKLFGETLTYREAKKLLEKSASVASEE